MKTSENQPALPSELKADLQEALENLAQGIRDAQAAQRACERMDRMREENRRLFGEQAIAVELIREMRDSR